MEGYVYILINPAMPGLLKIGCTKRSPEERSRELSGSTGVPLDFQIAYEIYTSDMNELENKIHLILDGYRINRNREFFKYDLSLAINLIRKKAEEIQLDFRYKTTGINETFDCYEAIEILGKLQEYYPNMIRKEIKSVRIYQTRIRCYLEITEEDMHSNYKPYPLVNQKVSRSDLGFICGKDDSMDSILLMPSLSVAENARVFIEELNDYSKLMCTELFTHSASTKIQKEHFKCFQR